MASRFYRLRQALLPASAVIACLSGEACQTSAPPAPYVPYEGINIDSPSLVAPYGCGIGPDQVYRYVATVTYAPGSADAGDASDATGPSDAGVGEALATGVFDCFADGVFEGLPGAASYVVTIYGFTFAESEAAGLACEAGAGPCVPPALDAGTTFSGYSWTTTCTATALAGASPFAQCNELLPAGTVNADGGVDSGAETGADSDADANPDAGTGASADASLETGTDSSAGAVSEASSDAGADATTEAAAPTDGGIEGGG
jgi:hypothetical protein